MAADLEFDGREPGANWLHTRIFSRPRARDAEFGQFVIFEFCARRRFT